MPYDGKPPPGRTAHFYYRPWRHLDVCSGDEGRCGRFSSEAFQEIKLTRTTLISYQAYNMKTFSILTSLLLAFVTGSAAFTVRSTRGPMSIKTGEGLEILRSIIRIHNFSDLISM